MMHLPPAEVHRLARLARLGITPQEAERIAHELAPLVEQMELMLAVDIGGVDPVDGIGAAGMPLRADAGPPMAMEVAPDWFAPRWGSGQFVVPPLDRAAPDRLGDS